MASPKESLCCPISLQLLCDPVVAQDGHTYERAFIENWIRQYGTSPLTRELLSIERLTPNYMVKSIIETFETSVKNQNYQFRLNHDVRKTRVQPLIQTFGKLIYQAEWMKDKDKRPEIILLKILAARARKEASFYVDHSRHPYIVRTFGLVYDESNPDPNQEVLLVQEYASQGSFYDVLRDRKTAPNESVAIRIFLQIIDAMIYLAANNIVHGDLACRNVLVFHFDDDCPEANIVKITDFGLSRYSQLYSLTSNAAQTTLNIVPIRYAAPEVLSPNATSVDYTEKSDVYSMGVLMWEAYSRGSIPWCEIERDQDVAQRVIKGDTLTRPPNCSEPYWSIILKTWSKKPSDRPTFRELKYLLEKQYYRTRPVSSTPQLQSRLSMPYNTNVVRRSIKWSLIGIVSLLLLFAMTRFTKSSSNFHDLANSIFHITDYCWQFLMSLVNVIVMMLQSGLLLVCQSTMFTIRYGWTLIGVGISEIIVNQNISPKFSDGYNQLKVDLRTWYENNSFRHAMVMFFLTSGPILLELIIKCCIPIMKLSFMCVFKPAVFIIRYNWILLLLTADRILTYSRDFPSLSQRYQSIKNNIDTHLLNNQGAQIKQQIYDSYRKNKISGCLMIGLLFFGPLLLEILSSPTLFVMKYALYILWILLKFAVRYGWLLIGAFISEVLVGNGNFPNFSKHYKLIRNPLRNWMNQDHSDFRTSIILVLLATGPFLLKIFLFYILPHVIIKGIMVILSYTITVLIYFAWPLFYLGSILLCVGLFFWAREATKSNERHDEHRTRRFR